MENDQEYRFSNWITKQPLENETPANITPLEDKESEYEKWFNEYEKFKSVFEVLDNKLIKFVEFMSGKNNGRFEFSYYVGLGRSGSGIATMLGLRANPPIPVGYLSDSQYPFPMKSYMMPNLALLHGIKDKADICIIDSVVKSGIHVIIAIDHIIKAHEIAGKSINSITVACVQFRYKHLIPDLVQEYIEKQYKNYNVYFVYGFAWDHQERAKDKDKECIKTVERYFKTSPEESPYHASFLISPFEVINENGILDPNLSEPAPRNIEDISGGKLDSLFWTKDNRKSVSDFWACINEKKLVLDENYEVYDELKATLARCVPNPVDEKTIMIMLQSLDNRIHKLLENDPNPFIELIIQLKILRAAMVEKRESMKWPRSMYLALLIDKYLSAAICMRPLYMSKEKIDILKSDFLKRSLLILRESEKGVWKNAYLDLSKALNYLMNMFVQSYDASVINKIYSSKITEVKSFTSSLFNLFHSIDEWMILSKMPILNDIARYLSKQIDARINTGIEITLVAANLSSISLATAIFDYMNLNIKSRKTRIHFIKDGYQIEPALPNKNKEQNCDIIVCGIVNHDWWTLKPAIMLLKNECEYLIATAFNLSGNATYKEKLIAYLDLETIESSSHEIDTYEPKQDSRNILKHMHPKTNSPFSMLLEESLSKK